MAGYNGNGTFSFTYNWVNDAANGIPITASRMDGQFNDAVSGFDNVICRDGQSTVTANIPWNNFKITGLGNPSVSGDALTYGGPIAGTTGNMTGNVTLQRSAATASNSLQGRGTTTAQHYWDITNTSGSIVVGVESSAGGTILTGSTAYAGVLTTETSVPLQLGSNNILAMTVATDQSVLIGTTTTAGWTGGAKAEVKAATGYGLSAWQANAGVGNAFTARVDNTAALYMQFWFGAATNTGSISTNGTTTSFNTSSDARLKENIADASDAGAIIDALRVRSWVWKSNGAPQAFGFVAQEEFAIYPDAVMAGDTGEEIKQQWGRDDSKLVPLLVKEIQSLRLRLAALEAK